MASLPAAAFDLTGHWVGSWSCTVFENGVKGRDGIRNSTLDITSLGNGTFRAVFDVNEPAEYHVRGIEIPDAAKPETRGEIAFAHCATNNDLAGPGPSELGRLAVSTSGLRGSLSGTAIWSAHSDHVATCRYSFRRVNTTNPGLTYACP